MILIARIDEGRERMTVDGDSGVAAVVRAFRVQCPFFGWVGRSREVCQVERGRSRDYFDPMPFPSIGSSGGDLGEGDRLRGSVIALRVLPLPLRPRPFDRPELDGAPLALAGFPFRPRDPPIL